MEDDELKSIGASLSLDWHDVRQRRVLENALAARRAARTRRPRPLRTVAIAASGWIAAACVIAFVLVRDGTRVDTSAARAENEAAPRPEASPSAMHFADGSLAILSPRASVQIEQQTPESVRIRQAAGEVRYRVVRNPLRGFVVRAGRAEITVVGTEFVVAVTDGRVRVDVIEGRVRVRDGQRELTLARSETVEMAPPDATEPARDSIAPPPSDESLAPLREDETLPPEVAPRDDPAPPPTLSIAELQQRADDARLAGRHDEAVEILERIIAQAPRHSRAAAALFTVGSIRRAQGRHIAAAIYFAHCRTRFPHGTLVEDALAQEAVSRAAGSQASRASELAREYVQRYPNGPHAAEMRRLMMD